MNRPPTPGDGFVTTENPSPGENNKFGPLPPEEVLRETSTLLRGEKQDAQEGQVDDDSAGLVHNCTNNQIATRFRPPSPQSWGWHCRAWLRPSFPQGWGARGAAVTVYDYAICAIVYSWQLVLTYQTTIWLNNTQTVCVPRHPRGASSLCSNRSSGNRNHIGSLPATTPAAIQRNRPPPPGEGFLTTEKPLPGEEQSIRSPAPRGGVA